MNREQILRKEVQKEMAAAQAEYNAAVPNSPNQLIAKETSCILEKCDTIDHLHDQCSLLYRTCGFPLSQMRQDRMIQIIEVLDRIASIVHQS